MAGHSFKRSFSVNDKDQYMKLDTDGATLPEVHRHNSLRRSLKRYSSVTIHVETGNSEEGENLIKAEESEDVVNEQSESDTSTISENKSLPRRTSSRRSFNMPCSFPIQHENNKDKETAKLITEQHGNDSGNCNAYDNKDSSTEFGQKTGCSKLSTTIKVIIVFGVVVLLLAAIGTGGYFVSKLKTNKMKDSKHYVVSPESLTISKPTSKPEPERVCIIRPTKESNILKSDPLKDRCIPGKHCHAGLSNHNCDKCANGDYMPKSCFCDAVQQCDDGRDLPRKKSCSDCMGKDTCPCLNGGNCTCPRSGLNAEELKCSCPKGFYGRYCEFRAYLCTVKHGTEPKQLNKCVQGSQGTCYVLSSTSNENYNECRILTDQDQHVLNDMPDCEIKE